jgi:signal transduction histidine kinase
VAAQRITILNIVNSLKRQLLLSIFGALGLGLAFVWFVGRGIIQALQLIGRSTARIARGDFSPLPVPATRDETRNVAEAFNRMIVELEKRQNQLVQEKKLASLGVLTSGIAHQLNNPLNNISTSCQILREEGVIREDEFTRELLDNIYHEVLRSRDIVKGLLEFSRVTDFSLKPVPLDAVVERSMRLVTSQLPAGVDISREIPAELMVLMDAQRMQEVFLNLFINAMQAIKTSPGRITIQAEADTAANQAVIRVADTGTGIAPENLGRIFDPFYTLKEVGKGTGLGLSIVFGIIKKHGGTIVAENRQDGQTGAVLTIRLPLERPELEEA